MMAGDSVSMLEEAIGDWMRMSKDDDPKVAPPPPLVILSCPACPVSTKVLGTFRY